MAFQVVDDVFDYTGKSSRLGKVVGTDLREKKATLPLIHALRDMTAKEKKFVEEIFSKKQIKAEDISEISRIIQKYDGFDYSMKQAISFAEEARKSLEDISPSMCKDSLLDAVDYVVERDR